MTVLSETPYTETEFLICVLNDNEERAKRIMNDMTDRELEGLRQSFRMGKYWIEEAQSIRFETARGKEDAAFARQHESSEGGSG